MANTIITPLSTISGQRKSRLPVRVSFAKGGAPCGMKEHGAGSSVPRPVAKPKVHARPNESAREATLPSYMRATEATINSRARTALRNRTSEPRRPATAATAATTAGSASQKPTVKLQAKRAAAAPLPATQTEVEQTDRLLANIPRQGLPTEYLPALQAAKARHTVRSTQDAWRCSPHLRMGVEAEMKLAVDNHFQEMRQEIANTEAVKRTRSFSFVDEAGFTADRQRFFELQEPDTTASSTMANEPHDSTIFSEDPSFADVSDLDFSIVLGTELQELVQRLGSPPRCHDESFSLITGAELQQLVQKLGTPPCFLNESFLLAAELELQDKARELGALPMSPRRPDVAAPGSCSDQLALSSSSVASASDSSIGQMLGAFPLPPGCPAFATAPEQSFSFSSVLDGTMESIDTPSQVSIVASEFSDMEFSATSERCLSPRASLSPRCASAQMSVFDPPSDAGASSPSDSQQCTQDIADAMEYLSINDSSLAVEDAILTGRFLEPVVAATRARWLSEMPKTPRVERCRKRVPRQYTSGSYVDSAVWDAL